jgi:Na+/melibiose symporter-like transporter
MRAQAVPSPGLRQFAAYALPALPLAIVVFPSHAILPGFYAGHTTIPLATIGIILIVARIFDAIIDPLIGYLSDATIGRWHSRKPWLVAGALVLAVSVVPLYAPAPEVGAYYFLGWFLAFYLGFSLIEIPYKAWGTELARDYIDRSKIATCLAVAFGLGNLAFALVPFLSASDARSYDAATLALVGWGVAIILPLAVLAAIGRVPNGALSRTRKTDLKAIVGAVRQNGPLLRFVGIFSCTGLGQGVFYGLVFLYVGSVLQLGTDFVWVLLADAMVTLLSVPVWFGLIRAIQKHRAWALGLTISAAALLGMLFLPAGEAAFVPLMALICLRAFGSGVTQVAPNALLGDVVDYELLKRNVNQAANFHALVSLITKLTATLGAGAGLLIVGLLGFDPKVANPPAVLASFKIVALLAPVLILLAGTAVAVGFPLHRSRHAVVLRGIERRMRHATAV